MQPKIRHLGRDKLRRRVGHRLGFGHFEHDAAELIDFVDFGRARFSAGDGGARDITDRIEAVRKQNRSKEGDGRVRKKSFEMR